MKRVDSRPSITDRLEYGAVRVAAFVCTVLPERLAYALVGLAGRAFFRVAKGRRRLALRFLRQAFPATPDAELLRIGSRSTANLFKVALDSVRLVRWAQRGRLLERIDLDDLLPRLPPAPFLVVTAHLGCWEAGAMALAAAGYDVHAVGKAARNPLIDRWVIDNRQRAGMNIHPRRGGIRTLVRVLARGGVSAMVVDQNQRLRPVIAPFFGHPARCERSTAAIALRGRYPVVVGAVVRVGGGMRFRAVLEDTVTFAPTGDSERDLVAATTRLNELLENLIRRAPEQYLWLHDRFRGAPAAAPAAPSPAVDTAAPPAAGEGMAPVA
ncbi:MAG TPA: lysophospholipid acyltransferase family protein [Planctomycetota bacterium]|nr:lysophospholipid acyltransferase family protein [Planctomycetota bacterium]